MTVMTPVARRRTRRRKHEGAAASHWVRPWIEAPPRPIRVLGSSGPACYLDAGGGMVLAVELAGAALPNAISLRSAGPRQIGVAPGGAGVLGGGALQLGDRVIAIHRWWDPRPRLGAVDRAHLRRRQAQLPPPQVGDDAYGLGTAVRRLHAAVRQLDVEALPAVVADLIGRGPGSTPTGDDVLAGLLATLRCWAHGDAVVAAGADVDGGADTHADADACADAVAARFAAALAAAVAARLAYTSALSATLLRCAGDGAVARPARRLLVALSGDEPLQGPVDALVGLGHTSGRDLLTGIAIAIDLLTGGREPT
jgi:hypothetical protein